MQTTSRKLRVHAELPGPRSIDALIQPTCPATISRATTSRVITTWRIVFLILSPVAILLIACGSSAAVPQPAATPFALAPEEVIERTRTAMAGLDTFRFRLTHSRGATLLPGDFSIQKAVGVVSSPDKIQLTADTIFAGLFVKIDAVIFPDVTYMTNPLTRNWNILKADESPFSVFDPPGLIADILSEVTTVTFPDDGPISDGVIVLEGTLPASAMRLLVGGTDPGRVIDYRMSIETEKFRLVAVDLGGVIRAGEEEGTQRRIELSEFNVPVVIEPPI